MNYYYSSSDSEERRTNMAKEIGRTQKYGYKNC